VGHQHGGVAPQFARFPVEHQGQPGVNGIEANKPQAYLRQL
jgi:hypothetical protein